MSKHILVVDDDQAIRSLLQEALEDEAYEIETASDGLIAWQKITRHPENYEAILLDMHMPQMDGFQLIQALRGQRDAVLRSIIVLSSDNDAIQQAVGMGICHVMAKPFDLEAVLALVSSCLSRPGSNVLAS